MITSPGNARVKSVVNMQQKAKARRAADAFLVEGIKMFLEAPVHRIREVYISESFSCQDEKTETAVMEKLKMINAETVSEEVFRKISDTCSPQGILCVMQAYHYELKDMLKKENPSQTYSSMMDFLRPIRFFVISPIRTSPIASACFLLIL